MFAVLLVLLSIGIVVCLGEYYQRVHRYHPEVTRKFIHITIASFAATWPFFLSWSHIELISLLMFVGIVLSRYFHFFRAIHNIKRPTWGELFFAMSIGFAAVLSPDKWIFSAAMLHMGLADGMAALVGTLWGQRHHYKMLFGHYKSYQGTLTFYVLSILILLFCVVLHGPHQSPFVLIWLPLLATALENLSVAGTDNLLVPLMVVLLLY